MIAEQKIEISKISFRALSCKGLRVRLCTLVYIYIYIRVFKSANCFRARTIYASSISLHGYIYLESAINVKGYTFRGSNFYFYFASHLIRDQLLKTRICSLMSKFFPLRVDGCIVQESKQEDTKIVVNDCRSWLYTHTP